MLCPICRVALRPERVLRERSTATGRAMEISCSGCLALLGVELAENGHLRTNVKIPGGAVARRVEVLKRAVYDSERIEQVRELQRSREERLLLRVPEIFEHAWVAFHDFAPARFDAEVRRRDPCSFDRDLAAEPWPRGAVVFDSARGTVVRAWKNAGWMGGPYPRLAARTPLAIVGAERGRVEVRVPEPYDPRRGELRDWERSVRLFAPLDLLDPTG